MKAEMTELPSLSNHMFLDDSIEEYVAHVRASHAPTFDIALRLNELANRSLFCATVSPHNDRQVVLATLLRRILTAYQAVIILVERGLEQEAQVMLRTVLEITFKISAIAKNDGVAENFIKENLIHRRKSIEKYKKLTSETSKTVDMVALEREYEKIKAKIHETNAKEVKTWEYAKLAGLTDFYLSAYSMLSDAVHSSVGTLDGTLDRDSSGSLVGFKYGYSDSNLDDHLFTACECLTISLRAVFSIIEVITAEEIQNIDDELHALYEQLKQSDALTDVT
jgi:hypothetical protein